MGWGVVLLALAAANLEEISERVRAQGEEDETATKKVGCWCDATKNVLQSRLSDAESDLRSLHPQVDGAIASNTRLRLEVADHEDAAAEHAQSLDAATAIRESSHERFVSEEADSSSALNSLKYAQDAVAKMRAAVLALRQDRSATRTELSHPVSFLQRKQHSASMVAGTLQSLEDSFSSSLDAAREDEAQQKEQYESIASAKQRMLKLETEAAQRKQARVAESEAKLVRDKQTIAGLEGRQAADQELLAAVNRACSAVEDGAAKRTKIRNELNVALSQTRANQAHARAFSLQQED